MTTEQMKEYIELCKNEAVQNACMVLSQKGEIFKRHQDDSGVYFIPHLGQLVEILGDRFYSICCHHKGLWECSTRQYKPQDKIYDTTGSTPEIACARAIIELSKNE